MELVHEIFRKHFGREPSFLVQAPGRVNLIGEHTDYNDGFVFPVAIDKQIVIAATPRQDSKVVLYSLNFASQNEFHLDSLSRDDVTPWSNYPRGIAYFLKKDGYQLNGLEAMIASDLPMGAGLSSSAAFELASACAFLIASRPANVELKKPGQAKKQPESGVRASSLQGMPDPLDLIQLCQRAENEFVGVNCGIMDQFISALGQRQHALFLDCRTLAYQQVPLPDSVSIVVCNTGVKRELATSEYNKRRNECDRGVQFFRQRMGEISALRDVSLQDFERFSPNMDSLIRKRCRHVISENERVVESVQSLQAGELEHFGQLMNASHQSLQQDYEVSCRELDVMVEIARQESGVLGSRMTGAGFGGCTVNLVKKESVKPFCDQVGKHYQRETGLVAEIYVCNTSDGAGMV